MNLLARRLLKLERETKLPADFEAMANDDLGMAILDTSAAFLAPGVLDGFTDEDRALVEKSYAGVLVGIRHQAALRSHPAYEAALDIVYSKVPGFVPAVCGMGCDNGGVEIMDLNSPGLFERRLHYLDRSDVRALIDEGQQQGLTLEFDGRYVGGAMIGWRNLGYK